MNPLSKHFATMAYNNAWANHRLIMACASLSQYEFVAARASFFPSIKATLNHNITVDWFYVDALEREIRGDEPNQDCYSFFKIEEPFDACADLMREQLSVDKRLIEYCKLLRDETINNRVVIARPGRAQVDTRTRLLSHLFQHQIHHRGQVHAMLADTLVKPPQLDEFFCESEAHLRADDFTEMGITEEIVWGVT